jgi:hypothetical protein
VISKRIVYTRHDGGVSVCGPSAEIFRIMQCGGYWDAMPRGFVDRQIFLQTKGGIAPDHAARFARAVAFGGCSEAEVWDIVKDRDCARHGTLHEIQKTEDLPDRWFRNAWRRSRNGGPIGVGLEAARLIQWDRLTFAADEANKVRTRALRPLPPIEIDAYRSPIERANDTDELRRIWPDELARLSPPENAQRGAPHSHHQ